jgi:ferritin-like metal-binding protein YciE
MTMSLRELLAYQCSRMLALERDLWQLNRVMMTESRSTRLKQLLSDHDEPSRQRISHLEQVVDRLGGMMGPETNAVSQGMFHEYRELLAITPPREAVDIADALEAEKHAHIEIAGYNGLLGLARLVGDEGIIQLLLQNLSGAEHLRTLFERELPTILSELTTQMRKAA